MDEGGKAVSTTTAAAVAGSNEGGVEVATEFARYSLRRGRSITDLQYSRRSLLHGCSFAAVYYTCARARVHVFVCVYVYLPPPWKEAYRQRRMETFCCRGRTSGGGGEEKKAVARGCCRWLGRRVVRNQTDPQVVLNPLPILCTSNPHFRILFFFCFLF